MRIVFTIIFSLCLSSTGWAQGSGHGGGGDTQCESRIHEIRKDLRQWISDGGASALDLTVIPGTTLKEYNLRMKSLLEPKKVIVTCVSPTQWNQEPIRVNGEAKTCKWHEDTLFGKLSIRCNTDRFSKTSEANQYSLIHHEFAALANIERSVGADSRYEISEQIPTFLRLNSKNQLRLSYVKKFKLENISYKSDIPIEISGITLFKLLLSGSSMKTETHIPFTYIYEAEVMKKWLDSIGRKAIIRHLKSHRIESLTFTSNDCNTYFLFSRRCSYFIFDSNTKALMFQLYSIVNFNNTAKWPTQTFTIDKIEAFDGPVVVFTHEN